MPTKESISATYSEYHTHTEPNKYKSGILKRLHHFARSGYLHWKYGYNDGSISILAKLAGVALYLSYTHRCKADDSVMYLNAHNGKLLDVGCGNGKKLETLKNLGWHATGTDLDPKAVEFAKSKGLDVMCGSLAELNFHTDEFDAITMNHVIEHAHDPIELLRECRRILKPGGKLVLVTPNTMGLASQTFKNFWRGWEPPRHLFIYSPGSMESLLKQAGFVKHAVKTTTHGAPHQYMASRRQKLTQSCNEEITYTHLENLMGFGFQIYELLLLKYNKHIGDEIVAIAHK